MDWSDESYVKLYTRDTVTWRSWPWQARAVWPSLMRKLDGAGLMPAGRLDMTRAVAVMIEMPVEVVEVALDALLADGTIETVAGGLLAPKFLEAQEARKNDRLRAAEYRGRARAIAKATESQHPPVTPRHTPSLDVTERHSPAPPRPAQPNKSIVEQARPVGTVAAREVFAHWQRVMKKPRATFIGKRLKAVEARLRDGYSVEDLKAAIDRRSVSAFVNDKGVVFNDLELICRDASQVERETTTPPTKGSVIHEQTAWSDTDDFAAGLSRGIP